MISVVLFLAQVALLILKLAGIGVFATVAWPVICIPAMLLAALLLVQIVIFGFIFGKVKKSFWD